MFKSVAVSLLNEHSDEDKCPPLDTKRKHRDFKLKQCFVAREDLNSVRRDLNFENAE